MKSKSVKVVKQSYHINFLGNPALMDNELCDFTCDEKMSGVDILKTLDFARKLRDQKKCVIGLFNNFVERESLKFLLKGEQPIIIVTTDIENLPMKDVLFCRLKEKSNVLILIVKSLESSNPFSREFLFSVIDDLKKFDGKKLKHSSQAVEVVL